MGHQIDEASPADRRSAPRMATTMRGKLFPGGADCVVSDYSRSGAKLALTDAEPPEGGFVVVLWTTGIAFEAQPRWRAGSEIGVQFLGRFDLRGRTPGRLASVKAAWLKRQRPMSWSRLRANGGMVGHRGPV